MDREIKFRHWDKDTEKMYYQDDLVDTEILGLLYSTELVKGKGNIVHMQFTGLQDKNGKDIYEGDIIKMHNMTSTYFKVEYIDYCFCATAKRDFKRFPDDTGYSKDHLTKAFAKDSEIIGNIYENKELL